MVGDVIRHAKFVVFHGADVADSSYEIFVGRRFFVVEVCIPVVVC